MAKKKVKDTPCLTTAMIEQFGLEEEAHGDDYADNPMAGYRVKVFALEEDQQGTQTRKLAATCNVFISRYWIDQFPDDARCSPLWDDTVNNFGLWDGMRERVALWRKWIDEDAMPGIEFAGEDLLIFDDLKVKRDYRRLGVGSHLCRFVRTTVVSPHAGALIVALVNETNKGALAFWRAFGLTHQIGRHDNCIVLAGLWQGAFRQWADDLKPCR